MGRNDLLLKGDQVFQVYASKDYENFHPWDTTYCRMLGPWLVLTKLVLKAISAYLQDHKATVIII